MTRDLSTKAGDSRLESVQLRAIRADDWPEVLAIQAECYTQLDPEPLTVLQSKWLCSPRSCFAITHRGRLVGYCLAHPWVVDLPPALYQELNTLPGADSLYLHDIAISARARGLGAGRLALERLEGLARELGLGSLSLVAVQGADGYWQKMGFQRQNIAKSLASYTDDACYMVCPLVQKAGA
jgi:ribosomal protein S18 acetylase RimI-like enzyme